MTNKEKEKILTKFDFEKVYDNHFLKKSSCGNYNFNLKIDDEIIKTEDDLIKYIIEELFNQNKDCKERLINFIYKN